ncbi:carbohydrate ABC transporter permease [Camelliibacillus cellulosilyticus]|uniref:Carbohydrate ABC transporter permease n=1 Tax=Camelliibacillus cellulosilyticus TaxID=2174486 RepID=A0ABV9GPS9_9BACL
MVIRWLSKGITYLVLCFFAFLFLYPIFLMVVSSLKTKMEIWTHPLAFPSRLSLENFKEVWERVQFSDYIWNSVIVTGVSVLCILFIASLAGFYLSRYPFKWNKFFLFFFMIGLMLPMKLAILPLYMIMMKLYLLDTLLSLIVIYIAHGMPLAIFIFYAFFRTVPKDLEQSAKLDGCSDFQVYYKIILPLMKPALATVGIVNLISIWNDFFYPLIFIRDESLKTIPLGMQTLFGEYTTDWNLLFAGLTLASLPMIIAFLFASRQFVEGLTTGAVK